MITTRRQLLVNGLRVVAAVPVLPYLGHARFSCIDEDGGARVLVVLQLSGGNDALNMVVPRTQDAYFRLRPSLSLARGGLHGLDDDHGLHPEMGGLGELFEEGRLAIVHGVGYPNPNRSHFRSMEIWHTADPDSPPGDSGWMGRLADQIAVARPGSMAALHVGSGDLPLALYGREYFSPTVRDPRGFQLKSPSKSYARWRDELLAAGEPGGDLAFLREAAKSSYRAATRMEEVAEKESPVAYPGHGLARHLQLVARLIVGDFGTRVFHVSLGGFDTHAQQKPLHAALLQELSASLTAFQRDLEESGVADRVVTMVFSEFGRRARENASTGTDHGAAAPVLLVGSKVRAGMHGTAPDLGQLENDDIPPTTDFRSIYTALEKGWMGLRPSTKLPALELFSS
ncbi:MAG: DUF1501 domain-containing protein [Planctomycetota bacterium]|nr:DUF1501 domain-containing protein [Planctomycetota bacterium]